MPNVGSNELRGHDGSSFQQAQVVYGHDGTDWKYAKNVYGHNGSTWVEVWNARPEVVSTSVVATSGTNLSFAGTADPNNFATTAKFQYREVGAGTWNDSSSQTSGLENNVDGAKSVATSATVADTYKNWEARIYASNDAGNSTGSTVTRDCRQQGVNGGSGWGTTTLYDSTGCDCGTKSYTQYSKSGCYTYNGPLSGCSDSYVQQGTGSYPLPFPCTGGCDFVQFNDVWGNYYLAWNEYGLRQCPTGACGCLSNEREAIYVRYCATSNTYTYEVVGCVTVTFF